MHWTERISFYVYTASHEQHEQGVANKSRRYDSFGEALVDAQELEKQWPNVSIERHAEFHDGYYNEWCIDWDRDGGRQVVYPI